MTYGGQPVQQGHGKSNYHMNKHTQEEYDKEQKESNLNQAFDQGDDFEDELGNNFYDNLGTDEMPKEHPKNKNFYSSNSNQGNMQQVTHGNSGNNSRRENEKGAFYNETNYSQNSNQSNAIQPVMQF